MLSTFSSLAGLLSPAFLVGLMASSALSASAWAGYKFGLAHMGWRREKQAARLRQGALAAIGAGGRRDGLTGLLPREAFLDLLGTAAKSGRPHAALIIDIDGFSTLNAAAGFAACDQVLAAVGERLAALNLAAPWARLATDEFAIVLPGYVSQCEVEGLALTIIRACSTPVAVIGGMVPCTVSLGAALLPSHGNSAETALMAAYAALRAAKIKGISQWLIYDPAVEASARARAAMKASLKEAIESGRVVPYYQPIVDLTTHSVAGLEILARWEHPEKGLIPPDIFIPLAEETGLADELTHVLMQRVARDARFWPAHLSLSFNIAPCQLRELIRFIQHPPAWADHIAPDRLAIEITESALIEDIDLARELVHLLQARGTAVVLDDFGIGYSNFFHLRELQFDRIKIDKSFILDCASDPRADACVRAMLAVASNLGIAMVAEGIEQQEVASYLARLGCRYGQGYLFSKPVPGAEVPALLRRFKPALRRVLAA